MFERKKEPPTTGFYPCLPILPFEENLQSQCCAFKRFGRFSRCAGLSRVEVNCYALPYPNKHYLLLLNHEVQSIMNAFIIEPWKWMSISAMLFGGYNRAFWHWVSVSHWSEEYLDHWFHIKLHNISVFAR